MGLLGQLMGKKKPEPDWGEYAGGGMVQGGTPTISEYFNMQGKTLGGSNNKSLAQILGRKQHG